MKSKLLQKKSYRTNRTTQLRDVVDGQHENIEGSSVPWKGRETGASRCAPTIWAKGKVPTASSNGRAKKEGPGPETCRIRPRPVTLRGPSITVSKENLDENESCSRSSRALSVALSGFRSKKTGCSEGCPKFPFLASPRRGEGSLPCRLFPSDFCVKRRRNQLVKNSWS
jgi:hypothetical protein